MDNVTRLFNAVVDSENRLWQSSFSFLKGVARANGGSYRFRTPFTGGITAAGISLNEYGEPLLLSGGPGTEEAVPAYEIGPEDFFPLLSHISEELGLYEVREE